MPWNGAGSYSRSDGTFSGASVFQQINGAGTGIVDTRLDAEAQDMALAINNTLCKDGQNVPTANLPMATFKHTNVGDGAARDQYTSVGQTQDGKLAWAVAGGAADALTATYSPALTALVDGQYCFVRAASANATTTPTFAPNGLTAHTITKQGGAALVVGEWATDQELILRYKLASTRWELVNPSHTAQEGSWTPVIAGSSTPGTQTYSIQVGRYIRQGNLVTVWGRVAITAVGGTTAGSITIAGLPFTASNIAGLLPPVAFSVWTQVALTAGYTALTGSVGPNTNALSLNQNGSSQNQASVPVSGLTAGTDFAFSGTYRIN